MTPPPVLEDFPNRTVDLIRYGDTDRQGHVNNAVFATFFETGRVSFLFDPSIFPEGTMLVIARLVIDFRAEVTWPGQVEIGTRVEERPHILLLHHVEHFQAHVSESLDLGFPQDWILVDLRLDLGG